MKNSNIVFKSPNSHIYCEENTSENRLELIKVLNTSRPTPARLSQFLNEYEVTKDLNIQGVRKALRTMRVKDQDALVLEYVEGATLEEFFNTSKPSLKDTLKILISLAHTLGEIHQEGIIHKDLNIKNILVSKDYSLKIIDFGNSTKLNLKSFELSNPKHLEGTLAFISPEQTGRMNRVVDFRSDLYSLGVIIYWVFGGKKPFESEDELELVHDHIARIPSPLVEVNPEVHPMISKIVEILLAKNAEDRYQSAFGLEYDFQQCLNSLQENGKITDFKLQQRDASGQLLFSDKLFGRDQEIKDLMAAFDRSSIGNSELVMVAGYSGIGKSALINELHKPITLKHGRFISGKFDQLQRSIPHYAFISAIDQLVDNILTHEEAELKVFKESILNAMGSNAGVLTSVIPSLELIIGKQETPAILTPREAQNRFNWTFEQFIYAIATAKNPLVLFIDDLQWCDPASLDLLEVLVTKIDSKYLLIIGAYRNNEVDESHPLVSVLERLRESEMRMSEMELSNLDEKALNALIADAMNCSQEQTQELAKVIFQKTSGNCFYTIESIKSLHQDDLIHFDHSKLSWSWDISKISQRSISANVGELLAIRSEQYSIDTKKALKIAACIGNTFDLKTLSSIHQKSQQEVLSYLWKTLEDGWVLPLDNSYNLVGIPEDKAIVNPRFRFSHDRVQELAIHLQPELDAKSIHLAIGRQLMSEDQSGGEDKLFELVNHFDMAKELVTELDEMTKLCHLNIEAARKAETNAAFYQAQSYAEAAVHYLPAESWKKEYELTFATYKLAATTNFINGNFERSKELIDLAIKNTKTNLEKVECLDLLINQYMFSYQFSEALETGREALGILGFSFPSDNLQPILGQVNEEIQALLQGKQLPELIELPVMTDQEKIMVMRILSNIGPPCYIMGRLEEFTHTVFLSVKLSLEYGNSLYSPYAYVQYGLILGFFGQHMVGYMFGDMACKLSEKGGKNFIDQKARTYFIMAEYVQPWVKPFLETELPSEITVRTSIECGNNLFRGYAEQHRLFGRFYQGVNLKVLHKSLLNTLKITQKNKHMQAVNSINSVKLFTEYYLGEWTDFDTKKKEYYENSENLQDIFSQLQFHIYSSQAYVIEGNFEAANQQFNLSKSKFSVGKGLFSIEAPQQLYGGISLIQLAKKSEPSGRESYLKEFEDILKVFEAWSGTNPQNFKNKYSLLLAEKSVLEGNHDAAMNFYKDAIEESATNNFLVEQALSNELAGLFYLSIGNEFVGYSYLKEAQYLYIRWGAAHKVNQMSKDHPKLAQEALDSTSQPSVTGHTSTGEMGSSRLDLRSVIKASEAISSEIRFDKMVNNLISVAVENAGALARTFYKKF